MRKGEIRISILIVGLILMSHSSAQAFFDPPLPFEPVDDSRFGPSSLPPVFRWENQQLAAYEIEFALDPDFTVSTGPLRTDLPEFQMENLVPVDLWESISAILYWHIRGIHVLSVRSEWSGTWCFSKSLLEAPVPLRPVTDARFGGEPPMPFFEWTASGEGLTYQIQFSVDEAFSDPLGTIELDHTQLDFGTVDPSAWYPFEGVFFWRVAGIDLDHVPSPWSAVFFFTKTTLTTPHLVWPGQSTRFPPQSDPPQFEWLPVTDAVGYGIRFSLDRNAEEVLGILNCTENTFDLSQYISQNDWNYAYANLFWSVSGFDFEDRPGPWSETREMTKVGYHRVAAYGDSITYGECFENGYLDILRDRLLSRWPNVSTINQSVPGKKAGWGASNIEQALIDSCPEFILILFGTNDTVDPYGCSPPYECNVEGHLQTMVEIAWNRGTTPLISTILPLNPEGKFAGAQSRMDGINDAIRSMAYRIGAPLVDLDEAFQVFGEDLPGFFCDWGHPNFEGYEVMAEAYYQGIISHGG